MYCAAEVDELLRQWKQEGQTKELLVINTAKAEIGWPYVWGAVGAECTPDKRKYYAGRDVCPEGEKKLIISRCQALNGSGRSCGGCEYYPGNMRVLIDDCQGFAKQVLQRVGISLAGGGCTSMWYKDSNWTQKGPKAEMPNKVCLVFCWSAKNQNMSHVGIHIGDGVIIECSGTVRYNNVSKAIWTHYALVRGLGGDTPMPTHPTIRKGSTGPDVVECQNILIKLGYDLQPYGADGKFGNKTVAAVKAFQSTHTDPTTGKALKVDGVVGPATWAALEAAVPDPDPSTTLYTVQIPHCTLYQAEALRDKYAGATIIAEVGDG